MADSPLPLHYKASKFDSNRHAKNQGAALENRGDMTQRPIFRGKIGTCDNPILKWPILRSLFVSKLQNLTAIIQNNE